MKSSALSPNKSVFPPPIILKSKTGLGKTHLLNALILEISKKNSTSRIRYLNASDFVSKCLKAIKDKCLHDFIYDYIENTDFLFVENINDFSYKEGIQDVFLEILEKLYQKNAQIILSKLTSLRNDRLSQSLSQFLSSGLEVSITPPDQGMRTDLVHHFCKKNSLSLNEDIVSYISSHKYENIVEIKRDITKLQAHLEFLHTEITLPAAKEILNYDKETL